MGLGSYLCLGGGTSPYVIADEAQLFCELCATCDHVDGAPMRMDTEDPWALTELARAGGPGGALNVDGY